MTLDLCTLDLCTIYVRLMYVRFTSCVQRDGIKDTFLMTQILTPKLRFKSFQLLIIFPTGKNTEVSSNLLVWKRFGKAQLFWGFLENHPKLREKCAFSQKEIR